MDIYFPLLEELLHGSLAPERAEHADGLTFTKKLQQSSFKRAPFDEVYLLEYPMPLNAKCTYYRQLLITETEGYCTDVKAELALEQNENVLHYNRKQILDDHLTTCLMRLGEHMHLKGYFEADSAKGDTDFQSNGYIYQLLKICLVKAFLEIQDALQVVITHPLSEKIVRASIVQEPSPFVLCLTRHKQLKPKTSNKQKIEPDGEVPTKAEKPSFYTMKEVCDMLHLSDSTVTRRIQDGTITAKKEGSRHLFEKSAFDAYLQSLPTKERKIAKK